MNFVFWISILAILDRSAQEKKKKFKCGVNCVCIRLCKKRKKIKKEPIPFFEPDEDVVREAMRVVKGKETLAIKVTSLKKVYHNGGRNLSAVNDLSFGVSKGECFSLLGVNGAGKSTIFKMLTGEEAPTQGTIQVQGMELKKNFDLVRKLIGYCP